MLKNDSVVLLFLIYHQKEEDCGLTKTLKHHGIGERTNGAVTRGVILLVVLEFIMVTRRVMSSMGRCWYYN